MNKDLLKSIIFHIVVAILLIASSWSIFSRKEEFLNETPIVVSLAPMGEKTNIKPAPKRETKPPTPQKAQAKTEPEPAPPTPAPKVQPKPEVKKEEPKKDEKPQKKQPDKPKEKVDELDSLLKNLDKDTAPSKSSNEKVTKEDSKAVTPFDPNSPEALAEVDYINKIIIDQLKQCWSPPVGDRNAKNMVVRLNVDIGADGSMKFVGFDGDSQYASDQVYLAAADAAKRAVLDPECNPLKTLPPADKYSIWKEMTITFDPKEQGN